jgi:hypothetical protein
MTRQALALLALLLPAVASLGGSWEARLQDGTELRVDPRTNKAWYERPDGSAGLLWDGVHRLRDGSVIIIRDGTMVPTQQVIEGRRSGAPPQASGPAVTTGQFTPCTKLVTKTCGPDESCVESDACRLAEQLRGFELEELKEVGFSTTSVPATRQCEEALMDEGLFSPCMK